MNHFSVQKLVSLKSFVFKLPVRLKYMQVDSNFKVILNLFLSNSQSIRLYSFIRLIRVE